MQTTTVRSQSSPAFGSLLGGVPFPFLALAPVALSAAYPLSAALQPGGPGYPLDDSWIHQTLARNLAGTGVWAINPGEPAAASTAPLWTALLALGYLLGAPHFLWAFLLGAASLLLLSWQTFLLGQAVFGRASMASWVAGLLVPLEWHLAWAAFSGMETVLFAALCVGALQLALRPGGAPALPLGLLAGAGVLLRPEGVLVAAPIGLHVLLRDGRRAWRPLLLGALGLALGLVPFASLNMLLSGSPLPSTFYAKNAAYGAQPGLVPYLQYLGGAAVSLARGPLLLLYPGLALALADRLRAPGFSPAWRLLPLAWCGVLLAVYMVWLPALYHHGRYLFPLIPVLLLYGLQASHHLLRSLPFALLPRAAAVLLALLLLASWVRGAQIFGDNVAYVNGQQVRIAVWAAEATPPDAVLATHDIGALSYFGQRRLVDIAGLATPELRDSPRDTARIVTVLDEKGVDYVVLQPEWLPGLYQALAPRSEPIAIPGLRTGEQGGSSETTSREPTFHVLKLYR